MAGVNKVIIVGNLGKDPELRHTPQGQAVCNFTVATSETWNDKTGQKQERTEWHRIVVWGKLGELCGKYLSKGRQAYIEGKLQTRQWDDQNGQKRYTTEVVANTVQFLSGGAGAGANRQEQPSNGEFAQDPFGAPPSFDDQSPSPAFGGGGASAGFGGGGGGASTDDIPF